MNCLLTRQPPLTRILMTARMAGPKSFLNLQHRTRSAAMIQLPPLPFAKDALSPHISAETLEYHYGKHHQAYVNNLNQLIPGTKYENLPLEDIVRSSEGKIFNNAAQVWNHTFYWTASARMPRANRPARCSNASSNTSGPSSSSRNNSPKPPSACSAPAGPGSSRCRTELSNCGRPATPAPVSYTHLRAHETRHDLVCRLLLEKKKKK